MEALFSIGHNQPRPIRLATAGTGERRQPNTAPD
jgi:hypothetical protein